MQRMSRRDLVLTSEGAGHPFRRSLPRKALAVTSEAAETAENAAAAEAWRMNGGDWRRFLSAYCATFVAALAFIA